MTNTLEPDEIIADDVVGGAGSSASISFKGEIEIFPNQWLITHDQGPIKAYAARSRSGNPAFALLCERSLVPHIYNASKYYAFNNPAMPKLLGAGLVDWTPLRQKRYVIIYEDKLGKPIATKDQLMAMGLKPDLVLSTVIRNLSSVLKDMRDADFVHGNIRLSNLYDGGGSNFEKVMLGECLSTPMGYSNSVHYETIERALADPAARGMPSFEDDMYSFGVLLAMMMRPADPFPGISDADLIQHKIEHGSYATLTGKERFTGSILELLRGLLNDDPRQRWSIDDVLIWVDGRRVASKQTAALRFKANRPLEIENHKFLRPDELAIFLPKSPSHTARLIDHGEMRMWLTRSIQDKQLEENVENAVSTAKSHGTSGINYDDRLSAFVCMALAPNFPIMYRGVKVAPQGFGRAIVDALVNSKDISPYVDIIQTQMVSFWISCASKAGVDTTELFQTFEVCRAYMRQNVIGYGIERCIYLLAPEAPCLSEKFKDYHVRTPEEMLMAYETMAAEGNRPENFFDRHIVAFLSVRDRAVIEPFLPDLNAHEKYRQTLAVLKIFAEIQKRSKLPSMPHLGTWIIQNTDPIVNRFHDRDKRQKLRDQISSLRDKGDLTKLLDILDNTMQVNEDLRQFRSMITNFVNLRREYMRLEHDLEHNPEFGHGTGRQTAAVISGMVASVIVILFLLFKSGGG
jgi:hypothetical protein